MTKDKAIRLIRQYDFLLTDRGERDPVVLHLLSRWPEDGSEYKAMRWLGFIQGVCYGKRIFKLDEIKEHSRSGIVK